MKLKGKVDWVGRQPDDPSPILYFSGVLGKKHAEKEIHERTKLRFRCISYHYLMKENRVKWATNYLASQKVRMFLDSGAFTLQKDQNATWDTAREFESGYVNYLKGKAVPWDWYAPVDWRRSESAVNQSLMSMQEQGLYPCAVYHGNEPIDVFRRQLDLGFPLISIAQPQQQNKSSMLSGDKLRRHYQQIFNLAQDYKVALHGFSQTGTLMFECPWYSVDSTSWCAGSSRGQIFIIDQSRRKISAVYLGETKTAERLDWRNLPDSVREPFRMQMAKLGFTEEDLIKDYMARISFNILAMQEATLDTRNQITHSYQWQKIL